MYNSYSISNYFLRKGNFEGVDITPMKALKLVYLAHGWHLGEHATELITDRIEAWKYGPVIPMLYHRIKHYRNNPIESMINVNNDGVFNEVDLPTHTDTVKFLDGIWDHYKSFSGLQLSTITHEKDSPWHKVYHLHGENSVIPNDLIKSYYQNRLNG